MLLDHLQDVLAGLVLGPPCQDDVGDLAQIRCETCAKVVALEDERGRKRRPDIGVGL